MNLSKIGGSMFYRLLEKCIVRGGYLKSSKFSELTFKFLIFTIGITFFSCENFMNGSQLKQKFDEAVEYANAEPFNIRFSESNGKISPSGEQSVKVTDEIALTFSEDTNKCFIKWQIVNDGKILTDEEALEFVRFGLEDDKNDGLTTASTKIKILKKCPNMKIQAKCAQRPAIVSWSPQYDSIGAYRDRNITVMFDTEMDLSSIYYDTDELRDLEVLSENESLESIFSDGDLKSTCETSTGYNILIDVSRKKCYGYKFGNDDNSIVFKNIKISNLQDKNINLLKHFEAPCFDRRNPRTLRIPAKSTNEIGLGDAPPQNTEILVVIESGVKYKYDDNIFVGYNSEFPWAYLTNKKTDNEPPEFVSTSFHINESSEDEVTYNASAKSFLTYTNNNSLTKNVLDIKNYNLLNKMLWVALDVVDSGSGPDRVVAIIKKLDDQYYPLKAGETAEWNVPLSLDVAGQIGSVNEKIDLSEILKAEGLYSIGFEVYDKNNHCTVSDDSYQFVYDVVPPKINSATESRTAATKTNLTWTNPSEKDFANVKVIAKNEDKETADIEKNFAFNSSSYKLNTKYSNEISGLTDLTHYSYKMIVSDYAGNESCFDLAKDETAPGKVTGVNESRGAYNESSISWNYPNDVSQVTVSCYKPDGSLLKEQKVPVSNGNSCKFSGLERGKRYKYKLTTCDYANNTSTDFVEFEDRTAPSNITGLSASTRNGYVDLHFETPSSVDFDYLEISYGDNDNYTKISDVSSERSKHYDIALGNATNGVRYYYGIRAVDYSGNVSSKVSISEVAGVYVGQIVHVPNNDLSKKFVSLNCYKDKNPIGVVCEASDLSSIKIWDIYEYTGYTWGSTGKPCGDEQLRYENYWIPSENSNRKINVSGGLDWLNLINTSFTGIRRSDSIWTFVNNKNASSPVTWYIPGVLEYKYLLNNYNSMKDAYTTLKNAGYDNATLISAGQPYWTGVPRVFNPYAYVVQFKTRHKDSDNRYGCDWTLATNSASDMGSLYVTSSERESGWFYKDKNYDTARGVTYYLRTHAMAQIDMR